VDAVAPSLARRPDFRLGSATIRPSIRTVEGPGGNVTTEPRVMQVLIAFVDANGAVLTRDDLLRICWSGMVVGDDSINRAVAEVRRIARTTGAGFGVETIPRVGYRLTGGTAKVLETNAAPGDPPVIDAPPTNPTRRWIIGGAIAATGVAGAGIWAAFKSKPDPRYLELMARGKEMLRSDIYGGSAETVEIFNEAVKLQPKDATAWGLLSQAQRYVSEASQRDNTVAAASEQSARRALALNRREPNALLTMAMLQRVLDDWYTTDQKVREVLTIAPDNIAAYNLLVGLLQASGYIRESWDLNEQAIALDPLRPMLQYRRALKLWIMGKPSEADRVAARARELWPQNFNVWNARLLIYAFTGQLQAARNLVDDPATVPAMIPAIAVESWRLSLAALETRSPGDIAKAREANLAVAPRFPVVGVHAILVLSELNELDAAYSIIDGMLLRRGQLVADSDRTPANDPQWRQTQWLYTPATDRLRADPRYKPLCDAIGLTEYWRRRGIGPDERPSLA